MMSESAFADFFCRLWSQYRCGGEQGDRLLNRVEDAFDVGVKHFGEFVGGVFVKLLDVHYTRIAEKDIDVRSRLADAFYQLLDAFESGGVGWNGDGLRVWTFVWDSIEG